VTEIVTVLIERAKGRRAPADGSGHGVAGTPARRLWSRRDDSTSRNAS